MLLKTPPLTLVQATYSYTHEWKGRRRLFKNTFFIKSKDSAFKTCIRYILKNKLHFKNFLLEMRLSLTFIN